MEWRRVKIDIDKEDGFISNSEVLDSPNITTYVPYTLPKSQSYFPGPPDDA